MATPIVELILADLKTALEGVSGIVSVNRGKWVEAQTQGKNTAVFPYINMGECVVSSTDSPTGIHYKRLDHTIEAYALWVEATAFADIQQLMSDIEAAVMADPRRDGNAVDTLVTSMATPGIVHEFGYVSCTMTITVTYAHSITDPEAR